MRTFPSSLPRLSVAPPMVVTSPSGTLNLTEISYSKPIIIVRYLGYVCAHCVEQLSYLNQQSERLRELDVSVYAFSPDDTEKNALLYERLEYDPNVVHLCSDPDNAVAKRIGAMRVIDDTARDLHVSMVMYNGRVVYSTYTESPYLDVERLVATAVLARGKEVPTVQETSAHPSDKYLTGQYHTTIVAGAADGIVAPLDLDFNQSPLHPDDLWVVTTSDAGHSIAIIHHATDAVRRFVRTKKDSRASHFMWRTHAIAMGNNGTFATAQNGAPGNMNPFYQFMGPTLWSADTAVFASRYQDEVRILASHLDMLHQSPQNLGIAHDHDNVYWVSDGYYEDITMFDFRDPHEVGGTDHRDGIIRRYTDVHLTKGELGEPGHIALHRESGWLYIVDPGGNRLLRLNTRTGAHVRNLVPAEESMENLAEYSEWKGAQVDTLVTSGLGEPVGIAVDGNRVFVGDRLTGHIIVFQIVPTGVEKLGIVETGAEELLGICYGPDQRLWFVDRATATVGRVDTEAEHTLTAKRDVVAASSATTLAFAFTNGSVRELSTSFHVEARKATADGYGDVVELNDVGPITIGPQGTSTVSVPFSMPDTTCAWQVTIREVNGTAQRGVHASTIVVPNNLRRIVVDDALMETFRISQAVSQTNRQGYASLRSDVFVRIADSLEALETVLWNGGSFGELSVTDDAVLNSLLDRNIEVMLIADDPLMLRTDMSGASAFFRRFGVSLAGVDQVANDDGQRVFSGVANDTIGAPLKRVDCQLPRLDHHRGNEFVPNILFRLSADSALPVLTRQNGSRIGCVRYTASTYRTVILGMNAARILDGAQRTQLLDRALLWLETQEADSVPPDTTTSVAERGSDAGIQLQIRGTTQAGGLVAEFTGNASTLTLGLYASTGQLLNQLYQGPVNGHHAVPIHVSGVANGTLFIVAHTPTGVVHRTISRW